MTPAETLHELRTLSDMAEDLVHDRLSVLGEHNGLDVFIVRPQDGERLHLLIRQIADRARRLETGAMP